MDIRQQKKNREIAAKLSRPRPVEIPSGKWRCQIMVDGKRIDVIEDDPAVAHAKALAIKEGLIEENKPIKEMTIGEAIDRYIESKDTILSPSTIRGYRQLRENSFQDIMNIRLSVLTQEHIQRAVNKMAKEKSPKTIRNAHGLLSATLTEFLPNMVLRTTLPQKQKHEISIPTTEEVNFIAEKAKGTPFELPFLLAAWMGLRTSEIKGLTWDCVQGDTLHIKQAIVEGEHGPVVKATKTYSGNRKIPIPKYIKELIEQQPHKDEYIIHYTKNSLYNHFRRLCKRYNLPHYRFHDLRHYQASVMLALGVPDKYAMERMGHASTNMLKTVYQHTMKSKSEEVADTVNSFFEQNLHMKLHIKE